MAKQFILPLVIGLALAACGSDPVQPAVNSAQAEQNAVETVPEGENVTAQVMAMTDRQRNMVFVRALMDAEIDCDGVTGSERVEDYEGKPIWRASCKYPGKDHLISITPDGMAEIITRSDR